ncbi:MAG: hypothetical protein QM802_03735 [Agriterribacter sp.]
MNSLHFISKQSEVETYRNDKQVFIPNKISGSQVYELKQGSPSDKYDLPFYFKTKDADYFLITKKGIPFFIPVTIRQALELSINNITTEIAEINKQSASTTILTKEAWIKKEGIEPTAGITAKQAKDVNDAGYQGYLEGSKALVQGNNFSSASYKKSIEIIKEFLKTASADDLNKPAFVDLVSNFYEDGAALQKLVNEKIHRDFLVTINTAYLKTNLSKVAPQFICVEIRAQTNDAVTQKAFTNFEQALDFKKLESLLAK